MSTDLAIRQSHYLEEKKGIIESIDVSKLSRASSEIIRAGLHPRVQDMPDEKLIIKIAAQVKFIIQDVGIRNVESMKHTAAQFMMTLKKYYGQLSLNDVKVAFEMCLVGELDEYLPKNKYGDPDSDHYQEFNKAYYTKVLNAYMKRRAGAWSIARQLLPEPDLSISDEEKEHNRKAFLQDIYDAFDNYKEHGTPPEFIFSIFFYEFVEAGLIKEAPEITRGTVDLALKRIIGGNYREREKKATQASYEENKYNDLLYLESKIIQNNLAIKEAFDRFIKEGKDIREFVK